MSAAGPADVTADRQQVRELDHQRRPRRIVRRLPISSASEVVIFIPPTAMFSTVTSKRWPSKKTTQGSSVGRRADRGRRICC